MNGTVACPDCGKDCQVKITKAGKPYYWCHPCGTQHFYRMNEGIVKLKARMKWAAEPEQPKAKHVPEPEGKPADDSAGGLGFFS